MCRLVFIFLMYFAEVPAYFYADKTPTENYLTDIQLTENVSGLSEIDCIYVINLDVRPKKWERVRKLLKKQGLNPNRVPAVNGWQLSSTIQQELAGPYPMRLLPGEVGCLLSHLSVLRDAKMRGFNTIWVMEDDIAFAGSIKRFKKAIKELQKADPQWDLFYTDRDTKDAKGNPIPSLSSHNRPDQIISSIEYFLQRQLVGKDIVRIRQRYGTYSMVLSKKGIEKILDYFTHVYLWSPIDMDIHYVPDIRQYVPVRDLVTIWDQGLETDTKNPPPHF